MVRRIIALFSALAVVCAGSGFAPSAAQAAVARDAGIFAACPSVDHPARFTNSATDVLVCTSTIQSGSTLHIVVNTRKVSAVQVQLLYPDGTSVGPLTFKTDKRGVARPSMVIDYNPVTSYAQAQLIVTVTRPGHTEVVPGTVTIAQAAPLGSTRLRARPSDMNSWCPADRAACSVRNNSNLVVRVDTDPGAQVAVTLRYPDGTSLSCTPNDLTSTTLADAGGQYKCELPIVYQSKSSDQGTSLTLQAQVGLGGYTQNRSLKLSFLVS